VTTAQLVFDLGFHRGEDTDHYLALGHRVVAVEANPNLAEQGQERFAAAINSGQLTLVHAAVLGEARALSVVAFHPHPSRSEWGSVDLRWVQRNAEAHGLPHDAPLMVQATTLQQLVAQFGTPWLLKIDIEGTDEEVLVDLAALDEKPAFVSWETGKESLAAVLAVPAAVCALRPDRAPLGLRARQPFAAPLAGLGATTAAGLGRPPRPALPRLGGQPRGALTCGP